jgi:hypothetical protein
MGNTIDCETHCCGADLQNYVVGGTHLAFLAYGGSEHLKSTQGDSMSGEFGSEVGIVD